MVKITDIVHKMVSAISKKHQIFISSTYKDLKDERLAAASAILDVGHIPAGMEQFSAEDKTQLDVIRRWIDESDIYVLILGSRYGSVDAVSGKSYTHLEYEYALSRGIPILAVLMRQDIVIVKLPSLSSEEQANRALYDTFRTLAEEKTVEYYEDAKDIKLAIHKALKTIVSTTPDLGGWISTKELPDFDPDKVKDELRKALLALTNICTSSTGLANAIPCGKGSFDTTKAQAYIKKTHKIMKETIIQTVGKGIESRRFCVYEPTQVGAETVLMRTHEFGFIREPADALTMKLGEGFAGKCFVEKKLKVTGDVDADPDFILDPNAERVIKSLMCMPVLVNDETVSVVNIDSTIEDAFDEFDKYMVELISKAWSLLYVIGACQEISG